MQHPVGECQHFTSIVAAERGEYHGTADEEEHCVAGNGEGRRVPPGEVESEGQRDAEHEAQRAGVVERRRVAANPPPVPDQHESGEADESECPGGGGKARRELLLAIIAKQAREEKYPHQDQYRASNGRKENRVATDAAQKRASTIH